MFSFFSIIVNDLFSFYILKQTGKIPLQILNITVLKRQRKIVVLLSQQEKVRKIHLYVLFMLNIN